MDVHPSQQEDLEIVYSKYQLLPKLREEFSEVSEDLFTIDALVHIYLHRQADPATMVGILSPKFGSPQEVADKLLEVVTLDLIDYDQQAQKFIVKMDVSHDVEEYLERYQYPLPMVIKPKTIQLNDDTGYMTISNSIVLNSAPVGEGVKPYFVDTDMNLDHINRMNAVPLALDMDLVRTYKPADVPRKIGEDLTEYLKKTKQKDAFYQGSVNVMEELAMISDTFYLTHKYDRRGRCYASGYHVNYQGDPYHKAVIQFANKEVI